MTEKVSDYTCYSEYRSKMLAALVGLSLLLSGVVCPPGRPLMSIDLDEARHLFHVAELKHGTVDGFLTKTEVESLFIAFDGNGDGSVTETEFTTFWQLEKLGHLQAAVYLFHRADTDNNGVLTRSPDLDRIFTYFDQNSDNKVSEPEFAIVWASLTS